MGHVHGRQVCVLVNKNLWLLILSQIFAFTAAPVTVFLSGIIGSQFSPIKLLATLPMALSIVGVAIFAIFAAKIMSIIGRRAGFIFSSVGSSLSALLAAYSIIIESFILFNFACFLLGAGVAFSHQYRFAAVVTVTKDIGESYLVNGQKVWTSYADKADWIFALVRTGPKEPKHDGISFLLIDMATKGVTTKPITLISGKSPFCETFFDSVEVPKENLIGELNAGWTIAKKLLQHERAFISNFGLAAGMGSKRDVVSIAKKHLGEENGKIKNNFYRSEISSHKIKEHAFGLTLKRAGDEGGKASATASMFKLYGTEHNKKRHELMVAASGINGVAWDGDEFEDDDKNLTRAWLRTKGNSLEGGTSEVQLNVISKRVLGLPSQ